MNPAHRSGKAATPSGGGNGGGACLITGGASGIGAATARLLAISGVPVAILDINGIAAEALAARLRQDGADAIALTVDVADHQAVEQAVDTVSRRMAPIRRLVASAGITGSAYPVGEIPAAEWRGVMAVNLDGVFNAVNAAFPVMANAGGGAVVVLSSVMGCVATGAFAPYVAAKHALIGLVRAAAIDGAMSGIRVNAVGPGYIETALQEGRMNAARRKELAAKHVLGRWGKAEEVAPLIVWLLSDEASFITGSHYLADGGYTAL